jgi:hypothetical protein
MSTMPFTCHPIQKNRFADAGEFTPAETIVSAVDLCQRPRVNNIPANTYCKGYPVVRLAVLDQSID